VFRSRWQFEAYARQYLEVRRLSAKKVAIEMKCFESPLRAPPQLLVNGVEGLL